MLTILLACIVAPAPPAETDATPAATCEDVVQLAADGTPLDAPTGYTWCWTTDRTRGALHRIAPAPATPQPLGECTSPDGGGCATNEDCDDGQACLNDRQGFTWCNCTTVCASDDDCAADEACVPMASARVDVRVGVVSGHGTCVPAACHAASDCASGTCRVSPRWCGGGYQRLSCASVADACDDDAACDPEQHCTHELGLAAYSCIGGSCE